MKRVVDATQILLAGISATTLFAASCVGAASAPPPQDSKKTAPPGMDLDKWFEFSKQPNGFLYPQTMLFDESGTHTAALWTNAESRGRPNRSFLEAYQSHAALRHGIDLPMGMTAKIDEEGRRTRVSPNGYSNQPPFPEFDYSALVRDLFDRFLYSGLSPTNLGGVYLTIDIEHGFPGYRSSTTAASGSVPGVFRSGSIYYDDENPDSPLNCARAAFLEGQELQLQMCKLAELIRRESIRRFGSPPVVGWYNMLALPNRVRINKDGEIDGSGRTPPNVFWKDLTPEQKKTVLDRLMTNCRPLMQGGRLKVDGVRYPGLDALELNALQDIPLITPGAIDNRNHRATDLGRRLKAERAAGANIPPVVVSSSWAITDKQNSEQQGQILPQEQIQFVLIDAYRDLDISAYVMCQFNWSMLVSNCFNLELSSWDQMTPRGQAKAHKAWEHIWSIIVRRQGTAGLPGYQSTARATIGTGGFSNDLSTRNIWLQTLSRFLQTSFGDEMSRACSGPPLDR